MSRLIFLSLYSIFIMPSCNPYKTDIFSEQEAWEYFEKIILGSEYKSKSLGYIKKWQKSIKYTLLGEGANEVCKKEMQNIVLELRTLTQLNIQEVNNEKDANIIIFLGKGEDFVKIYEAGAKDMIQDNDGIFFIYWNNKKEIYKANIYINSSVRIFAQKHLLREEFTQSLGFINDSYRYTESIFQTKWTYTQKFTKIDKFLIQVLYDKVLKSNMKTEEVKIVFPKLYQKYY